MNGADSLQAEAARLEPQVRSALETVRARIAAVGVDPYTVTIVAVTKGHGPGAVLAAARAGLRDMAENHADVLVGKASHPALLDALAADVTSVDRRRGALRWHFQGALQTNKIARMRDVVWCWHTVDSEAHAVALARRAPGARAYVQVNVTGAAGRLGCTPGDCAALVRASVAAGLAVQGLMAVGPVPSSAIPPGHAAVDGEPDARAVADPPGSYEAFAQLAALAEATGLTGLSAGMSDDYLAAVRAGSRLIRLGSVLFGARD